MLRGFGKERIPIAVMLALVVLLGLTGCGKGKPSPADTVSQEAMFTTVPTEPDTLHIIPANAEIAVGERKTIPVSYLGEKRLFWNSSDMKIATVDSQGCVTGISQGDVEIWVTDKEFKDTIQVHIAAASTAEAVAPVSQSGVVAAVDAGTAVTSVSDANLTSGTSITAKEAAGMPTAPAPISPKPADPIPTESAPTTPQPAEPLPATPNPTEPAPTPTTPTAPAPKLEISRSQITLTVGGSETLDYTYTGTETIRFGADFGKVDVDQSGRITALRAGTDYVYVTDGKLEKVCIVDIQEPVSTPTVSDIEFSNSTGPLSGTYNVGNSLSWTATNKPNGSDYNVSVSSSNNSVAAVSKSFDGRYNVITVNFIGEGSVTITVTSSDGCASNSVSFDVKTYVPEIPANELSPEQFARAVVNAMVSCGMEEASGLGGWCLVNVPEGDLNNSDAYSLGANFAADLYSKGCTKCNCIYMGRDNGKYQFYIQF